MAPALPQSADSPSGADDRAPAGQTLLFHESQAAFGAPAFGAVIGQIQDTFIVSASDDEVFFIDQHMAHERVLFERLLRELDAGPLASQELLFPQPVELGSGQAGLVAEWASTLEGLGFGLEGWSGATVVLRAPVLGGRVLESGIELEVGGDDPISVRCAAVVNAAGLRAQALARSIAGIPQNGIPATH